MFLSHIDNFAVEKKYLAPRIQVALEFLRKTDWSSKADGKYVIDGDVIIANLATYTTKPKAECKAETHLKYIDIQYKSLRKNTQFRVKKSVFITVI